MAGEKGKQILKLRKESCLLSSLSAAKANPCWRESSCSCLQLMLGGLSPLGRFSWVCLNKQTNPWDEKNWGLLPSAQQSSLFSPCHLRHFLLAEVVVFGAKAAESAAHAQCRLSCGAGPAAGQTLQGQSPRTSSPQHLHKALCFCTSWKGSLVGLCRTIWLSPPFVGIRVE